MEMNLILFVNNRCELPNETHPPGKVNDWLLNPEMVNDLSTSFIQIKEAFSASLL